MPPLHLRSWVLLATLGGCGQAAPDDGARLPGASDEHAVAAHAHTEPATHADHADGLVLDHGSRWSADAHTRSVMAETRTTLAADVGSVDEARALGAELQEQLDRLVRGCTMTGAAHDQLHVFLSGWAPAVAALRQVDDVGVARAQLADLRTKLATYDRYFA